MTIQPGQVSEIFRLVASHEFTANFGPGADGEDLVLDFRAEILRGTALRYRARLWEIEPYRMQPSFPQEDGTPSHDATDEFITVDRAHFLEDDLHEFDAESDEAAFEVLLDSLRRFMAAQGIGGAAGA